MILVRPISVRALTDYRIYLEFSDGQRGEVDLSQYAGKGVFAAWNDYGFFQRVRVSRHRSIEWDNEIELCPDALYMQLTGKAPDELFPKLRQGPSSESIMC
jgi:Protein of unknown function (DUF2442)